MVGQGSLRLRLRPRRRRRRRLCREGRRVVFLVRLLSVSCGLCDSAAAAGRGGRGSQPEVTSALSLGVE